MLSSFERGVIILVNNALKSENSPLPEDFDYSRLYGFAKDQQISTLIFYGGKNDPEFLAKDEKRRLYALAMYLAASNQDQMRELERLCRAFEENGIDFMRLKGSVVKWLYPSSDMRIMGDADVLIRREQMDEIENLMLGLGYSYLVTSDHEWIWHRGGLDVELHKRMIPSYTKDLYAYFGDGWALAEPKAQGSHEHVLRAEEELIYLVAHFTKHYRYAGIGIKHLVDIYVFLEAHKELDLEYVNAKLEKLGIASFYRNIRKTLEAWFGGAEMDECAEFITHKVFSGGAYGTDKDRSRYEAAAFALGTTAKRAKRKKFLRVVFPSYKNMSGEYPWLKRCPVLLPFAWIYRIIHVLLFRRDHVKRERENIAAINKTEIEAYKSELKLVGLDFNFEV